jgi:hypothetical protein
MSSAGMLRRVDLVRTDVSEELSASVIKVTRISELGTLAVTSNRRTLRAGHVSNCSELDNRWGSVPGSRCSEKLVPETLSSWKGNVSRWKPITKNGRRNCNRPRRSGVSLQWLMKAWNIVNIILTRNCELYDFHKSNYQSKSRIKSLKEPWELGSSETWSGFVL